jgi:NAD+ kinase
VTAHAVRPLAEGNFASLGCAMGREPVEDGLGLRPRRLVVAGEIGKPLVIAQDHAAMAFAVPQAGLRLKPGPGVRPRRDGLTHVGDEGFTASPAIGTGLFAGRVLAGAAHNDFTHVAVRVRSGIAKVDAFNVGNLLVCQRDETGMKFKSIAFLASDSPEARKAMARLVKRYGNADAEAADAVVALGGDGHMLQTLHRFVSTGKPIYGMNRGTVGFLMNDYQEANLMERLQAAELTTIHPLRMVAKDVAGKIHRAIAFNEVSLLRQRYQAAKLRIAVDGKSRMEELICDGILVSTPAGSTAYNLSAHGPILPINSELLALTPISAFRPRGWRGAILPHQAKVTISILDSEKRPVAAVADHVEVRNVQEVQIAEDRKKSAKILFDPGHSLAERVLREQFRF